MVKKLDDIFVLYENNGKCFRDYSSAYHNSKHCSCKRVNYVFTPTATLCKDVNELYRVSREYFSRYDCDYIDCISGKFIHQVRLFEIS